MVEPRSARGAPLTDGRGWQESSPQDDIYLIAGRYQVYTDTTDPVVAQVYLRTSDENWPKALSAGHRHFVEFYQKLIGTYPYKKICHGGKLLRAATHALFHPAGSARAAFSVYTELILSP